MAQGSKALARDRAFVFPGLRAGCHGQCHAQCRLSPGTARDRKSEREAIAEKIHQGMWVWPESNGVIPMNSRVGLRQRVGLARALAVDAPGAGVDEPLAVDEQNRRKFQEDMLALVQNERRLYFRHAFHRGGV